MDKRTRCVLLFARTPKQEALAKGFGRQAALFEFTRGRLEAAAASLEGVDLFVPQQSSGTFGEKLANAFGQARAAGYVQIVVVPIDAPALGVREIADAFDELHTHDVVLGPSPDGGVYLLGLSGDSGAVARFDEVRWLTSTVASDLMVCFPSAAVLTSVIADVDRRTDMTRLRHDAALDADLAALLFFLLSPAKVSSHESSTPARIQPAGRSSGRAPPARLSSI